MYLLEVENEENACICLRIIIDLHKTYRATLEQEVQPFLDIVQKFYTELPKTLTAAFLDANKPKPAPTAAAGGGMPSSLETPKSNILVRYAERFPCSLPT
jgi:transformation/transcription domain-associated protein